MVSKATEGINMSMMTVGAADYSKAIDGLSLSQAKLLLNMQGVDAEQQKSLLLQAGLISSSEKMTASHVAQALSNTTLKNTEQERVLIKAGLMNAQTKELILENNCTEAKLREALATTTLDATEKDAIVTRILGANANGGYAISFDVLTASIWANIKAMAKWLVTNPVGWCILAVGAIAGVSKIIDELVVTEEELNEQLDELSSKWEELSSTIQNSSKSFQSLKSQADELIPRYAELAQGVDKYGKNVSLTDEEFSEFVSLNNQLGQMFPELVMGYDSNGNAILALSGNVDTLTESLYAFVEAQRIASAQTIADTMPEVMSNIDSTVESYEDLIQIRKDEMEDLKELYEAFKNDGFVEEWSSTGESMVSAVKILNEYGIDYNSEITGERNGIVGSTRYKITVDWDDFETAYNGRIAGFEKEIDDLVGRIEAKWKQLNPVVSAWLSTDFLYQDLDMSGQSLVTAMVGKIDFKSLGLKTEEEIQNYITNSIITPIYDMDTKTQQAFFEVFDLHEALNKGELSVQEYQDKINAILENGTYSQEFTTIFKLAFAEGDLQSKYNDAINRFTNDTTQTLDDATAQYQEAIDNEYQKIQDWGLGSYAQQIKDGTIQSVFGNVDMDKRTIITWSDELKQTYKDALDSWDYDPEVGGIDTVFGGSDRFGEDLNGVGWEVAFTPILPDGTFLSQDAVYDYINTILAEAYVNDGKITEDELTKIDAQGRQIGNTFIHGIFAGIDDSQNYDNNGNWAETVGRLLHFSGDFGAVEIAKREKEKAIKEFSDSNVDLEKFFADNSINTTEEIDYWNKVTEGAESAKEAVEMYNKVKGQNPDKITVSFSKAFNSLDFSEQKDELLELAKAGELTPETLESTEEYNTLLTQTGLSAESVKDKIYDLLSAQEKLAGAHNGLDDLSNSYKEFKELNFVTAQTLEELPDVFKSLEGYDLFAKIVGNPKSGVKAIQQAFNDIVKEYLIFTQTLNVNDLISDDFKTQQHAINTYIANLKQMGVTNAEEVVNQTVESLKQQQTLLDNAATEYVDYLRGKNDVDLQYIESTASYNSQFINSLGEGYETDYNNWLNLLKDKELAYQRYVNSLDGDGDREFIYDPNKDVAGNLIANGKEVTLSSIVEFYTAKAEYDRISKKYEDLRNSLTFNPTFEDDFSPDWNGLDSGSGSNTPSDTYFDWIETKLDILNDQLDETKEKAENSLNGWKIRGDAFTDAENQINDLIATQEEAKARYLEEANKSGLPQPYIDLVKDGAIDIDKLSNDNPLKEQIESYQEWYDKVKQCDEAIAKLNIDLKQLYRDKREFRWEIFDYLEDSISRITGEADYLVELLSNEDLFDDNGNFTKYADATLGLHVSNLQSYKQQALDYKEEMESLEKELANGGGQEVLDKYNERVDAHRDAINAIQKEKQAILDLVENGFQVQLEALQKLIDKKKESLNAEKD